MHTAIAQPLTLVQRLKAFSHLCKPRVNSLIVFTAMIGMFLATPGFPPLLRFLVASLGIALVAFSAAALNCLVERTVDARMARTSWRATARGDLSALETITLATLLGAAGLWLLHSFINDLTMWLTLATFLGYWFMKTLDIGLTVATLPVMVLATGIGVDYAFYIYNRLQAHLAEGEDIVRAFKRALQKVGVATIFTALTLSVGVATWSVSAVCSLPLR
jgi:hypothetical protein